MAKSSQRPRIYQSTYRARAVAIFGITAFVLALLSLGLAIACTQNRTLQLVIVGLWTIVPPLWFVSEYFWVFDNWNDDNAVKMFKETQSLAAKLWAGVLAFLAAIYKVL